MPVRSPRPRSRTGAPPRWTLPIALTIVIALVMAACGDDPDPDAATTEAPTDSAATDPTPTPATGDDADVELEPDDTELVSFIRDVQPVVVETCARCHTGSGPGTPNLLLETADDVADNAFAISQNVQLGVMPPWPATDHSVAFQDDWSLDDDEIAAIAAWQEAGAPLDVDPDTPITPAVGEFGLADYDLESTPATGGYSGLAGQPDEYRCLVYDPALTTDRHIEAFELVPDQTEVVHHAIGYLIPGDRRERAMERDGEDGQPGWSCFGSSGLGDDGIFLGWAPGQGPTELPEGSGMALAAGDFLVIQVHYHFEVDAPPDLSAMRLRWSDDPDPDEVVVTDYFAPAEIPCPVDESGPLCDRDAAIARAVEAYGPEGVFADRITPACGFTAADFAGMTDGIATGVCDQPIGDHGQVISVLGHEHELGKSFRMTLNPDTPEEQVLLDIDAWDFDWQFNYYPVDEITVGPGDWIRLECSWDRSLRDPDLEPAYVVWADGTDDEMCFGTILIREISP